MSDKPTYAGYEWLITCPCGETMASDGMGRTDAEGEAQLNRRSAELPRSDGDTITCESCGRTWGVNFVETDS